MKRIAPLFAAIALLGLSPAEPVLAEVNVNVSVGVPALPVPPPLVLPAPPEFIFPPELGFYVAVDVPHDLFRVGSTFYLYRDNSWYKAQYYNGPWRHVEHRQLPPGLRKHKYERIRHYRDEEYRRYRDDHDHYRGRRFKPDRGWKEERKEHRKQERHYEKEDHGRDKGEGRGHGRHGGRDD